MKLLLGVLQYIAKDIWTRWNSNNVTNQFRVS